MSAINFCLKQWLKEQYTKTKGKIWETLVNSLFGQTQSIYHLRTAIYLILLLISKQPLQDLRMIQKLKRRNLYQPELRHKNKSKLMKDVVEILMKNMKTQLSNLMKKVQNKFLQKGINLLYQLHYTQSNHNSESR